MRGTRMKTLLVVLSLMLSSLALAEDELLLKDINTAGYEPSLHDLTTPGAFRDTSVAEFSFDINNTTLDNYQSSFKYRQKRIIYSTEKCEVINFMTTFAHLALTFADEGLEPNDKYNVLAVSHPGRSKDLMRIQLLNHFSKPAVVHIDCQVTFDEYNQMTVVEFEELLDGTLKIH